MTASGSPTPSMSISTGPGQTGLPAGATFNDHGDGTATLESTSISPAGTYTFTITATNGVNPDATQAFTLTIAPASVPLFITGSEIYGSTPAFSEEGSLPAGISVTGTARCTTVNGGTPITSELDPVWSYRIDGSSCSGLTLSGDGASNYVISYVGGDFAVTADSSPLRAPLPPGAPDDTLVPLPRPRSPPVTAPP